MNDTPTVWVAHRGQASDYPENTLAAIRRALECGARYIEVDVQCSEDGELYLMHDAALDRTTGISGNLLDMTSQQISEISAHEPARLGDAFEGEAVPRLSELAELMAGWPQARFFVEIKQESISVRGVEAMLARLTEVMAAVSERCIVISFSLPFIQAVKQQGIFDTGWIMEDYDNDSLSVAARLKPDYLVVDYRKVPQGEPLAEGPWQWMVYVVSGTDDLVGWSALKPHFVETSDICRVIGLDA